MVTRLRRKPVTTVGSALAGLVVLTLIGWALSWLWRRMTRRRRQHRNSG